jgi:hypothetical protein
VRVRKGVREGGKWWGMMGEGGEGGGMMEEWLGSMGEA